MGPELLDLPVLRFIQPVNPDVNGVVELRKVGAYFLAHDEVREVAETVEQLQATLDGIVVCDGDQVHPPALSRRVNVQRLGIAIPRAQEAEMFRPPREPTVAVQVGLVKLIELVLEHEIVY